MPSSRSGLPEPQGPGPGSADAGQGPRPHISYLQCPETLRHPSFSWALISAEPATGCNRRPPTRRCPAQPPASRELARLGPGCSRRTCWDLTARPLIAGELPDLELHVLGTSAARRSALGTLPPEALPPVGGGVLACWDRGCWGPWPLGTLPSGDHGC